MKVHSRNALASYQISCQMLNRSSSTKYRIYTRHEIIQLFFFFLLFSIPCKPYLCTPMCTVSLQSVCVCAQFIWMHGFMCVWEKTICRVCHSRVSLSVLFSDICCNWSELEITNSSFLSASSSALPLARAPWIPFLSSSFSCRLSRMKPGMQMRKETVLRPRVRPRYATLGSVHDIWITFC